MGRVTRRAKGTNVDSENISPNKFQKPAYKVKPIISKPSKSVLGDSTNICQINKGLKESSINSQIYDNNVKEIKPVANKDCKSNAISNKPVSLNIDNSLKYSNKKETKVDTVTNPSVKPVVKKVCKSIAINKKPVSSNIDNSLKNSNIKETKVDTVSKLSVKQPVVNKDSIAISNKPVPSNIDNSLKNSNKQETKVDTVSKLSVKQPVVNKDCKSIAISKKPVSSNIANSLKNNKKENIGNTVTKLSEKITRSTCKRNVKNNRVKRKITKEKNTEMATKSMEDSDLDFYGFEDVKISPLYEYLKKKAEDKSQMKIPTKIKTNYHPVYKTTKSSPIANKSADLLNLYDFEVDENEPVKKTKRKPILKMGSKKFRTYKKKKKSVGILPPLNLSNQENICPNIQAVEVKRVIDSVLCKLKSDCSSKKNNSNNYTETIASPSEIGNTPFNNSIDNNIEDSVVARHDVYSPQPYESPNRDSLEVPILRPSITQNDSPRSLNTSAYSSKCNTMINSPFSSHFGSPFYNGASTPIYKHCVDQTNNATPKKFDISNCFGFDEGSRTEEPFVSPIKMYLTPGKTPVRVAVTKKPSPIRMPHNQVIRMLKFGPEAIEIPEDDSQNPEMEDLLPGSFFHEGDSPPYEYSPNFVMRMPVNNKRTKKANNKGQKKKKVVINENVEVCKDETHSDLADRSCQEPDLSEVEPAMLQNRTTRARTRIDKQNHPTLAPVPETILEATRYDDFDNEEEVDISSFEQTTKKPRRSYERPVYSKTRKCDDVPSDEDYEPESEAVQNRTLITPAKTRTKKRNELSKKEKLELEKWAKAFNEQCMEVESFSLVVE